MKFFSLIFIPFLFFNCAVRNSPQEQCRTVIQYSLYDPNTSDFSNSNVYQNIYKKEILISPWVNNERKKIVEKGNMRYEINLKDCFGSADFKAFDKNERLIVEGSFKGYDDKLKLYDAISVQPGDSILITTYEFYFPLKHGTWNLYDSIGNTVKTYNFQDGYNVN